LASSHPQTRQAEQRDEEAEHVNVIARRDYKIDRKRSETILKLLAKLKIRKSFKRLAQPNNRESVTFE
jgi:ABC-type metal ion transport system substrate-binding protein